MEKNTKIVIAGACRDHVNEADELVVQKMKETGAGIGVVIINQEHCRPVESRKTTVGGYSRDYAAGWERIFGDKTEIKL